MMQFPKRELKIGRVLHEDDTFMTLEICKDEQRQLRLEDNDRFFTIIFLRHDPSDNTMEVWTPWRD